MLHKVCPLPNIHLSLTRTMIETHPLMSLSGPFFPFDPEWSYPFSPRSVTPETEVVNNRDECIFNTPKTTNFTSSTDLLSA